MSSTGLTLYKLIILYMLERVNFPLTTNHVTGFILEQGYTDYFHVQRAISELVECKLLHEQTIRNATYYQTTEDGRKTLEYFKKDISDQIKDDIDTFLRENSFELRNEVSTISDYDRAPNGEYTVHCRVKEGNTLLIDLNITVPTEEDAQTACRNWAKECQTIYMGILEQLI